MVLEIERNHAPGALDELRSHAAMRRRITLRAAESARSHPKSLPRAHLVVFHVEHARRRLDSKGRAVASRSKTVGGRATVPIFLLVPQVKLPKRLDLARDAARAYEAVPGLIVANWVERRIR